MHDQKGSALSLLTLGHISAYNMDNKNIIVIITLNVFGDFKKWNLPKMYKDWQIIFI